MRFGEPRLRRTARERGAATTNVGSGVELIHLLPVTLR